MTYKYMFGILFHTLIFVSFSYGYVKEETYPLLMPNAYGNFPELYLCTAIKLNSSIDYHIVEFEPQASMDTVHHMVLYGCEVPGHTTPVWSCDINDDTVSNEYELRPICNKSAFIFFAWAKNAPGLRLPSNVGFKAGGSTTSQYLVLQFHLVATGHHGKDHTKEYGTTPRPPPRRKDINPNFSGMVIHYTTTRMTQLAATLVLGSTGIVPPHSHASWESACLIVEDQRVHPFAFRVHAHHQGTVVKGYRVRRDSNGKDHWTLIGKKSPQKPNFFYPVDNYITLTKGDHIAARCSYYNKNNFTVQSGITDEDEMCNFYIMYHTEEGEEPLKLKRCWTREKPEYDWSMELNNIPEDASDP